MARCICSFLYMDGHLALPVPDVVEGARVIAELALDLVRESRRLMLAVAVVQ